MKLLIKNGRVIDPAGNIDDVKDILIENSKIARVAQNIKTEVDETIDAADKIVMPGIVDMHVHLREPGREDKETVASGTLAALKGGVTSCLAMPNTQPAIDCIDNLRLLQGIIQSSANIDVFIAAAITKGRLGREITDIAGLKKQGAIAITDDGSSVDSEQLFLRALKIARQNRILVICHSEDRSLSGSGVVNLGIISTHMGLKGISKESEYKRIERDIYLAQEAAATVHIAHVSCAESVEIIARAKHKGIRVTAETAPHYFCLSENNLTGYNTNMKVNPPLRSRDDVMAIRDGLKSGIIDAIASDHAPHTENEKDIEFERAAFGSIGLETELAASITELINNEILDWAGLAEKLALNPARILGLDKGRLSIGKQADIIVVDPQAEWTVDRKCFVSKSRNSAFLGKKLKGVVAYTICNGKIAYKRQDY
jgi:dihydroorotase